MFLSRSHQTILERASLSTIVEVVSSLCKYVGGDDTSIRKDKLGSIHQRMTVRVLTMLWAFPRSVGNWTSILAIPRHFTGYKSSTNRLRHGTRDLGSVEPLEFSVAAGLGSTVRPRRNSCVLEGGLSCCYKRCIEGRILAFEVWIKGAF